MKLRTLLVDLDCGFGNNHFNLVDCEECVAVASHIAGGFQVIPESSGIWTTTPAVTTGTVYISSGTTTVTPQWSTGDSGHYDHMHITVDNTSADTTWSSSFLTDISGTVSGTLTTDITKLFEEE